MMVQENQTIPQLVPQLIPLPNRGFIRISGADRVNFLQGLITNDVRKLTESQPIYSCFLTAQGRFLFDFFLIQDGDSLLLETEADRLEDFLKRLKIYKLRSQVTLENVSDDFISFAIIENIPDTKVFDGSILFTDPRKPELGRRLVWSRSKDLPPHTTMPFETYDLHRIKLTVPDGARDMTPERSFLMDFDIDKLNGIAFDKGCFMGQELTASMKNKNLGNKKLVTVRLNDAPEGADLKSRCGDYGLALIRVER